MLKKLFTFLRSIAVITPSCISDIWFCSFSHLLRNSLFKSHCNVPVPGIKHVFHDWTEPIWSFMQQTLLANHFCVLNECKSVFL